MRVTKRQLRRIIREEKRKILREGFWSDFFEDDATRADKEAAMWIVDLVGKQPPEDPYTAEDLSNEMFQDGFPVRRVRTQLRNLVSAGKISQAADGTISRK